MEAFILASRSDSFREAADRLALSPSAFTRRIQTLETFVGVPLFIRDKGTATLSRTGERYLRNIEPALDTIRRATVHLRAERGGTALRLIVPQSFALAWLIPHLPEFQRAHPRHRVEFNIGRSVEALRRGVADVAVLAAAAPPDMPSLPLADLETILVSAATLCDGSAAPTSLDALATSPRLAVHQPKGVWDRWLRGVGYAGPAPDPPAFYEAHFLMIEAAAAGLGVALTHPILAGRMLSEGRLVRPIAASTTIGLRYRLVYADDQVRRRPDVVRFARWLREELAPHDAGPARPTIDADGG